MAMVPRILSSVAFSPLWRRQMRFILGPRQVGKTTLAKAKLKEENSSTFYYLWDLRTVRNRYKGNELFFTEDNPGGRTDQWICFDEIHKMPRWKNMLKGIYDATGDSYYFVVTGSAKLNLVRRAGDSLAGRYSTFHLLPLTLKEVHRNATLPDSPAAWLDSLGGSIERKGDGLEQLFSMGGFPEPFTQASQAFHRKWTRDYADAVIREDIGSLTRITEREHILDLFNLLPEMVGSPVSYASLAGHLELSPITVKSYLSRLQDFYLAFSLKPYARNIKRSLLKAPKFYLYDWSRIADPAVRFENYVACELFARVLHWTDLTGEEFGVWYVRTKDKRETDFLITQGKKPALLIEAKLSDSRIDDHHLETVGALGGIPFIQVCHQPGVFARQTGRALRVSAARLFGC